MDRGSKHWSMKNDRELIELSKSALPLEEIAKRVGRSPEKVLKTAARLGLSLNRRRSTVRTKEQ